MPKSLRETWKEHKEFLRTEAAKAIGEGFGDPSVTKDYQKKCDRLLASFTKGLGPLFDDLEAAEKKKDAAAKRKIQAKIKTVIQGYQSNARKELKGSAEPWVKILENFRRLADWSV